MHIREAPTYINALHNQELLLRGSHISNCRDLAELRDAYDVLDLSNNDLNRLTGEFAELKRLSGLLLAHNKISLIDETFGTRLPRLEMLSLAYNGLSDISQLKFLKHMSRLEHLSLEGNPITESLPDYRDHIVALQPRIRFLDFERVREIDRQRAAQKFGEQQAVASNESTETRAEREALLARLENTTDLAEIDAIDKQLAAYMNKNA